MQVSASEDSIFATGKWQADTSGLVDFVRKNAEHVHQQTMDNIGKSEDFSQILTMSTCSSEFTDARTVLLAVMNLIRRRRKEGMEDEYTKISGSAPACGSVPDSFSDFSYGSWSCGSKDSCQRGIVR